MMIRDQKPQWRTERKKGIFDFVPIVIGIEFRITHFKFAIRNSQFIYSQITTYNAH
jgi:hypothetical protein